MTPDELDPANMHGWSAVSAYDGERLVAFGFVAFEAVEHAMIYDVMVDPEHQRQAIGSQIP